MKYGLEPINPINFYDDRPLPHKRACRHCSSLLGSANPGEVCGTCKWLAAAAKRLG